MANPALAAEPRRRVAGPVRITLPAKVAYDPNALKESITSIMERLGCPKCFSGGDCLFQMERNFVVSPKGAQAEPDPVPWSEAGQFHWPGARTNHVVNVGMSKSVRFDLSKVFKAVDKVIDLIGPHPCISGFDVLFKDELQTIVINEQLEGQRF